MKDNEEKSNEQLWKELLDIIDKQIEMSTRLKETVEPLAGASSMGKGVALAEETADAVRDLFVELEALQALQRAIYHSLFGTEE